MITILPVLKGKMTQAFVDTARVPVTIVQAPASVVTSIRELNGYWLVQLGFGTKPTKNISKALQGHLRGVIKDNKAPRFLCELKLTEKPEFSVGDLISLTDIFAAGDTVSVSGVSKGKGFAGGVKRWGFAGGPKTHGQSDRHRAPGSIGQGTTPGRVHKGKKMAGRMGADRVTVKNLHIVSINPERNEIHIAGPVPGVPGAVVFLKRTSEKQIVEVPVQETEVAAAPIEQTNE